MTYASDRFACVKVNALNGIQARKTALDAAGGIYFEGPGEPVDDPDECLPNDNDALDHEKDLGGYELLLIRRGYSESYAGSEFEAEYAVFSFKGPLPCFEGNDHITDSSPGYLAVMQSRELSEKTQPVAKKVRTGRL